jgi:hypothetical protein
MKNRALNLSLLFLWAVALQVPPQYEECQWSATEEICEYSEATSGGTTVADEALNHK